MGCDDFVVVGGGGADRPPRVAVEVGFLCIETIREPESVQRWENFARGSDSAMYANGRLNKLEGGGRGGRCVCFCASIAPRGYLRGAHPALHSWRF